ncbi:DNA repair protein XRCC1 [Bradysia coprophila]|uniref:DNA repair protein XRCC1 n=1 Tax=Bradysia coprophila TaxID=38358 RepID=UPI00187D9727|nr:DNA repair protein XRCC1 [Bradysia coprophila]
MPSLLFKSIKSFSSEDPLFPASNLLSSTTSTGKKWKCQSEGEKSAEVVLELESSSTITAIDIGNEHSAFVEVFVSKNGASEFQQILLVSSFMTPVESRNSETINRVRCFNKSALVEDVVESKCKWDLVKVVCTQPFNKRVKYGLSFIKLHSTDAKESVNNMELTSVPQKLFGNFKIREDSPDSDGEPSQSLFARWKGARNSGDGKGMSPVASLSAAAAIRNASTTASLNNRSPQVNRAAVTPKRTEHRPNVSDQADDDEAITKKNRNRSELMYEEEDDRPNEKLDKVILKERERLKREKSEKKNSEKKGSSAKTTPAVKDRSGSLPASSKTSKNDANKPSSSKESDRSTATATSKTKRQSSPVPAETPPVKKMKPTRERTYKPFHRLLEGVVLVISGIQNPARANIRQQALDMGAKYKADWEASCTHLICAFKNTPKYRQVHGHGKIITKDWIVECHKRKMRIPWRRFALDGDDGDASESEEEILDESMKPSKPSSQHSNDTKPSQPSTSKSPSKSTIVLSDDDPASDNESLDRYNLNSSRVERNDFVSSGSDTEDEIRRVLEKKQSSTTDRITKSPPSSDDIYNATTEEDEGNTVTSKPSPSPITPLPEWFKGKRFYLSRNVSSTDEIKLKRFVTVYGGEVTLVASESDYILSNVPKATPAEYKGEVVKPLWIFECNESETLLPTRRYNFSNY